MIAGNTPVPIGKKSQEAIVKYVTDCYSTLNSPLNTRDMMIKVDKAYMRTNDYTKDNVRAKIANAYGDSNRFQNVTVPIVMPAVEDSVSYQTAVFLQGNPIFGVVASPDQMKVAKQMEAIIEENSIRGAWIRQFQLAFRDSFKYNRCAVECIWDRSTNFNITTDIKFGPQGKPKEVNWQGNCIKRIDLYNAYYDVTCQFTEIAAKGDYFGYTEILTAIGLKNYIRNLPDGKVDNITEAFQSGFVGAGRESYFVPNINPEAINAATLYTGGIPGGTNWLSWAGLAGAKQDSAINYQNVYEITTHYARILPSVFNIKVPQWNTPQIWKFIIINRQFVIYAERQTNAHNLLPVVTASPMEDGLNYQTKSAAENILGFQETGSAMMNSVIAARRRAISDRGLFDPSRVTEANINSPNPSAKIPVRPAAYGKPLAEAYAAIPFRDDQSGIIFQELGQLGAMVDRVTGHNRAQQGQFVKGNKTLHEYADIMARAGNRDQAQSLLLECQLFTPIKTILKTNILQYQQATQYYNSKNKEQITIDPTALREALLAFKISDGVLPTEKIISGETLAVAFQTIASSEKLQQGYNIAPMFTYLMETQGADLSAFEKSPEQTAYESAIGQWQVGIQQSFAELKLLIVKVVDPAQLTATMDAFEKRLPPQPTPDQFGYDPTKKASA